MTRTAIGLCKRTEVRSKGKGALHAITADRGGEVQVHSLLTSALDGGVCSAHDVSTPLEFETRTVQPVA
jgi:hypothetical protein